jgi:sugar/nucleoside kinase (ribokinase family)
MIVVAGESLVDLVPSAHERLTAHCGGGPFNTARGVARLGQYVSFLGAISDDAFGSVCAPSWLTTAWARHGHRELAADDAGGR